MIIDDKNPAMLKDRLPHHYFANWNFSQFHAHHQNLLDNGNRAVFRIKACHVQHSHLSNHSKAKSITLAVITIER